MPMKLEDQYAELLKALQVVGEAVKGTKVDERVKTGEKLFLKFYRHADPAFYIYDRYRKNKRSDITDVGSINIIARAAFESFLLFHYIFVDPQSQNEKEFRYWAWLLNGELKRQQCLQLHGTSRPKLERQKRVIDGFGQRLRGNDHFQGMSEKQQKRILEDSRYKFYPSNTCMARRAELEAYWVEMFFKPLNDYVHSGSMSASQAQEDQEVLQTFAFPLLMVAMAFMVKSYVRLFPEAGSHLNSESKQIVEMWIQIGSRSLARSSEEDMLL